MDYEKLMKRINDIDNNAYLVTIEDAYYIDVTNCNYDNIDKIYNVLRDVHCDDGEIIGTVCDEDYFYCGACRQNKWENDTIDSFMRIIDGNFVCTDCLSSAESDNVDLAEAYLQELVNNSHVANEFLSDDFLEEHGFYNTQQAHVVGYYNHNDNVSPEKILESEQTRGNNVVFNIKYSNPFETEYNYFVRKGII